MPVKIMTDNDSELWDKYIHSHPNGTLYHLSGWKNVIEKTYGHKTYYLMVMGHSKHKEKSLKDAVSGSHRDYSIQNSKFSIENSSTEIVGILPLIHLKHFLFGNNLISIPFFDLGGVLADDENVEKELIIEAINLGQKMKVDNIELRHQKPLSWLNNDGSLKYAKFPLDSDFSSLTSDSSLSSAPSSLQFTTRSHKVRMLLDLPETSEMLMKTFKAKLRSQIKKPIKEGLTSKIGGIELLNDFYTVFAINMRDLGSPVHSKKMIKMVLETFPEQAKIVMIYKEKQPLACSVIVGSNDILENPWASALRQYGRLAPNMLLYWTMLEYACDNGYKHFDFGRSTPDEGTYKFKKQWGAKPSTLHWQYIYIKGEPEDESATEKSKFDKAIQYWQKLPVGVTKVIGPMIRKNIGL